MHNRYIRLKQVRYGFTLVEMMVVIAVIAILAGISVVIYTQVADKANGQSALSSLTQTGVQIERYKSLNGSYPASLSDIKAPSDASITLTYTSNGSTYCLQASNDTASYHVTDQISKPTSGNCPSTAAPAVVATAGNSKTNASGATGQSLSVPLPSGTVAGALVILQVYGEYNSSSFPGAASAYSVPSGYTLAGESNHNDGGWEEDMAVYYGTVASAGTTSYTISFANEGGVGPDALCASTTVISGVSRSGNPFSDTFANTFQAYGTGTSVTAPSFTPGGDHSLVMAFVHDAGNGTGATVSYPSAVTKNWGLTGTNAYCAVGTATQTTAAATGLLKFTSNGNDAKAVLVSSIRP